METSQWKMQRRDRKQQRAQKKACENRQFAHQYTAFIYERFDVFGIPSGLYDVEVFTNYSDSVIRSHDGCPRRCVYTLRADTDIEVTLDVLTGYMQWKFTHCQLMRGSRGAGVFTLIRHSFEWVKSIVDVEFDFHVGSKICTLPENTEYLQMYSCSQFVGYGPKFCDGVDRLI